MDRLRKVEGGYAHWCPGCRSVHLIAVEEPFPNGARWSFDPEAVTFSPSIRVRWGRKLEYCCHYFIERGKIRYCADSTHGLAGRTVELPEYRCQN